MTTIAAEERGAARVHPWTATAARPWRRFFARVLDNVLLGTVAWTFVTAVLFLADEAGLDWLSSFLVLPGVAILEGMATLVLILPIAALLISATGGTPGKWLFGVRVARESGSRLPYGAALMRELRVLIFGLGLGVPFVSLVMMLRSQDELDRDGETSWDSEHGIRVTYRSDGVVQTALLWLGAGLAIVSVIGTKLMALLPADVGG